MTKARYLYSVPVTHPIIAALQPRAIRYTTFRNRVDNKDLTALCARMGLAGHYKKSAGRKLKDTWNVLYYSARRAGQPLYYLQSGTTAHLFGPAQPVSELKT